MSIAISELPAIGGTPQDASYFPIVEGGVTKRVTYGNSRAKTISELDAQTDAPADADLLKLSASGTEKKIAFSNVIKDLRVKTSHEITMFLEENARNLDEKFAGTIEVEATGQLLSSVQQFGPKTHGIGHIVIVVNAGSDTAGTITINGDTVSHDNTSDVTVDDTETITISGLSTDNSDTDAQGNARYAFSNAYMTTKLFKGSFTITTSDVDLSDIDIYHLLFHHSAQGSDVMSVVLDNLSLIAKASNTAAWFYGYLYGVDFNNTTKILNLTREASFEITAADVEEANEYFQLLRTGIDFDMTEEKNGFFMSLFFGPDAQSYWQDITIGARVTETRTVSNV